MIGPATFAAIILAALTACASAPAVERAAQPPAREGSTDPSGRRAELVERLDSLVRDVADQPWSASVSVAVLWNSDTLLVQGYGHADVGLGVRATDQTRYRLVGPTTTMLTVLLLNQVEHGRISLDDDVSRWLPDFPWHGRTVTLRQLLDTSSGLSDYHYLGDAYMAEIAVPKSQNEVTALFADRPFTHEPGERQQWTISGFHLAGILLERIAGRSFSELLEAEIIRPLGLEHTSYCGGRQITTDLATGYSGAGETILQALPESPSMYPFEVSACGSAGDVATFYRALRHGQRIQPAHYAEMKTLSPAGEAEFARSNLARATGWSISALEGHPMHFETGGLGIGFNSAVLDFPEDDLTVVVLRNSTGRGSSYHVAVSLSRAVLGLPLVKRQGEAVPPLDNLPITAEERARYAGVYRTRMVDPPPEYPSYERTYRVYDENARLMIQPLGEPPERLLKQAEHTFGRTSSPGLRFVFTVEDGQASQIVLREEDRVLQQGARVDAPEDRRSGTGEVSSSPEAGRPRHQAFRPRDLGERAGGTSFWRPPDHPDRPHPSREPS
jgi:CubicO group peptidase (beta-lactamase class C family)